MVDSVVMPAMQQQVSYLILLVIFISPARLQGLSCYENNKFALPLSTGSSLMDNQAAPLAARLLP